MTNDEILNSIADDIERLGHWQGEPDPAGQPCCVAVNPTIRKGYAWAQRDAIRDLILARAGIYVLDAVSAYMALYDWNDRTPTEEVLRVLRGQQ